MEAKAQKKVRSSQPYQVSDQLRELQKIGGNQFCADCRKPAPYFIDLTNFVHVCATCSAMHRALHFRMKNMQPLWGFTQSELDALARVGNDYSNAQLLAFLSTEERDNFQSVSEYNSDWLDFIRAKYVDRKWSSSESAVAPRACSVPLAALGARFAPGRTVALASGGVSVTAARAVSINSAVPSLQHAPTVCAVPMTSLATATPSSLPSYLAAVAGTASSPSETQPLCDGPTVFAFAVGKDSTARRAVRVSRRYAERMNLPSTSAVIIPPTEEIIDVGELTIVESNGPHNPRVYSSGRSLLAASPTPATTVIEPCRDGVSLLDLNSAQDFASSAIP